MNLGIALFASGKYLYAWKSCVRRMVAAARHLDDVYVIYISDHSKDCEKAFQLLRSECPKGWTTERRALDLVGGEKYKQEEQLLIAKMQGEAFAACRLAGVDYCWTIEADVLVPPDALKMLEWTLKMPTEDGSPYYDVAMVTYPNGMFLGGRGDILHPIAEDFLPEERKMPEELLLRYQAIKAEEQDWIKKKEIPTEEWQKKVQEIAEEIKKCDPLGNVWELNAKHGWRPRGWLDNAYPGVGRGALLPVDWVGLGCNLLSKRALALATFEGYDGKGTQDLFLCWRRWYPAGLRFAVITHTLCDHVKPENDKLMHFQSLHEQVGEAKGHLRVIKKEWIEI